MCLQSRDSVALSSNPHPDGRLESWQTVLNVFSSFFHVLSPFCSANALPGKTTPLSLFSSIIMTMVPKTTSANQTPPTHTPFYYLQRPPGSVVTVQVQLWQMRHEPRLKDFVRRKQLDSLSNIVLLISHW